MLVESLYLNPHFFTHLKYSGTWRTNLGYAHGFASLDLKGEQGCELSELDAHKVLETFVEPMSVVQFRTTFKEIDLDKDYHLSLLEFLLYKFKKDVVRNHLFVKSMPLVFIKKKIDETFAEFYEIFKRKLAMLLTNSMPIANIRRHILLLLMLLEPASALKSRV